MKRSLPPLTVVALAVLVVIELGTHYDTVERQIALAVTTVATVVLFLRTRGWLRTKNIAIPWSVLTFAAVALWLDGLGNFQHLYARYWWWDRLTHVVGLLPATLGFLIVLELLQDAGRITLRSWGRALFAVSVANLLGAAYEISEWLGDTWFRTQRVTGTYDTAHDLLNNLVGSLVVVFGFTLWKRLTRRGDAARMP